MRMHISIETSDIGQIQAVAALLGGLNSAINVPAPTVVEETETVAEAPAATEAKRRGRPPKTADAAAPAAPAEPVAVAAEAQATKTYARGDMTPVAMSFMSFEKDGDKNFGRTALRDVLSKFGVAKLGLVPDDKIQEFSVTLLAKAKELGIEVKA